MTTVEESAARTGYGGNQPPVGGEPTSPADLQSMTNTDLGKCYDLFGTWYDFLVGEIVIIKPQIIQAEKIRTLTRAYLIQRVLTGPQKGREECVLFHPDFVKVDSEYAKLKAELEFQEARLTSYGNILRRISRHIALRAGETGVEQRRTNIGSIRGKYQPSQPIAAVRPGIADPTDEGP